MKIDNRLLDELTAQAQASPRLRMNFDLRDSVEDDSQRMLNALEPGTVLPIHRHRTTSETVVILRGRAVQYLYDDAGNEKGQWHRLESLESGTVIVEMKDGAYEPIGPADILSM